MTDHHTPTPENNPAPPKGGKYIDFFTDFGFKKLFGPPHRERLMNFLNSLLTDLPEPIIDLQYLQQEQLGNSEDDRDAVFDLYCKTQSGYRFIVEMQNSRQQHFKDRLIYYSTFPIQEQARRGTWEYFLYPVYSIALLNFRLDDGSTDPDDIISVGKITNIKTGRIMYDKLTYVFIEMPKFNKDPDALTPHVEKWLYVMNNLATIEEVPPGLREDVFMEFLDEAEIAKLDADDRLAYHRSLKAYRDRINTEEYARSEGRREGRQEGRQEGIAARNREIVAKMLAMGVDRATILEFTGLSSSELSDLEKLSI